MFIKSTFSIFGAILCAFGFKVSKKCKIGLRKKFNKSRRGIQNAEFYAELKSVGKFSK
jgi:hypothetical protein